MKLFPHVPSMVRVFFVMALLDVASVHALLSPYPEAQTVAIYWLLFGGPALGVWGGFEALHWMVNRSPWSFSEFDESRVVGSYLRRRGRATFRGDFSGWRRIVLRLQSGAGILFLVAVVIVWAFRHGLIAPAYIALALGAAIQFIRLMPAALATILAAPILYFAPGERDQADAYHGALALLGALAGFALMFQPTSSDNILHTVAYLPSYTYAMLVGGCFWWLITQLSLWVARDR